jgi:tape measure domain-containing protein
VNNDYKFTLIGKDKTAQAFSSANNNLNKFEQNVKRAGAALVAAFSAKELITYSDTYTRLQNRIKTVTDSQEELADTTNRLSTLAMETRSDLSATVELYTKLSRSTEELNLSSEDLYTITEVINKSFQIQGATTAEAAGATLQLSQALASGVLRGQEFNSVSEQGTEILRAISRELGLNIGDLRKMANEGKISADIVVNALLNQADAIRKTYSETESEISQSWRVFADSAIVAIGRIDDKIGTSSTLKGWLDDLTTEFRIFSGAASEAETAEEKLRDLDEYLLSLQERGAPKTIISSVAREIAELRVHLASVAPLETILEGVFSTNLSETAGGVGLAEAQAFAENAFTNIKTALAEQAQFEQESGEIAGLLSNGLFSIDLENLDLSQQAERDMWASHYQKLYDQAEAYQQERLIMQQAFENGIFNTAASFANQTAGMIESAAKEGSAAQKAAFLFQQAIAATTTIMNAEMASVAALAPPPIGLGPLAGAPYAALIRGSGYISAGIIAAQTIGSFEGGGYIPNGPRSGGLDGRGGQLAMVHPNESIIDHNVRGNSAGMSVSINFGDIYSRQPGDILEEIKTVRKPLVRLLQSAINTPL